MKAAAAQLGIKYRRIASSCPTRWWSLLHLLQGTLHLHSALQSAFAKEAYRKKSYTSLLLTAEEISKLEVLCMVLSKLEEISDLLGGEEYVTGSAVIPAVRLINRDVAKDLIEELKQSRSADSNVDDADWNETVEEKTELIHFFLSPIQIDLSNRYLAVPMPEEELKLLKKSARDREQSKQTIREEKRTLLEVTTFLDPRFGDKDMPGDNMAKVIATLAEAATQRKSRRENAEPPTESADHAPAKKQKLSKIAKLFGSRDETTAPIVSVEEAVQKEIQDYQRLGKVSMGTNPLLWWKSHAEDFPHLSRLARKYLAVPGTSVSSERVFSGGGRVITPERSCLTGEHAGQLIFLTMNKKYVSNT